ncbi:hypothetical protein Q8A67_025152 [Cirrhinus molitorella]|uniref:Uncharacterized protein n=1 Tax=Cirrhinus molitorella TaxID=172907 RepID=A0AA88NVN8_9TELE|nr:hypothetical protein Q8A67_025152 [Cirrhinus molitorella]
MALMRNISHKKTHSIGTIGVWWAKLSPGHCPACSAGVNTADEKREDIIQYFLHQTDPRLRTRSISLPSVVLRPVNCVRTANTLAFLTLRPSRSLSMPWK